MSIINIIKGIKAKSMSFTYKLKHNLSFETYISHMREAMLIPGFQKHIPCFRFFNYRYGRDRYGMQTGEAPKLANDS